MTTTLKTAQLLALLDHPIKTTVQMNTPDYRGCLLGPEHKIHIISKSSTMTGREILEMVIECNNSISKLTHVREGLLAMLEGAFEEMARDAGPEEQPTTELQGAYAWGYWLNGVPYTNKVKGNAERYHDRKDTPVYPLFSEQEAVNFRNQKALQ